MNIHEDQRPPEEDIYEYKNSFYTGLLRLTKKLFMF